MLLDRLDEYICEAENEERVWRGIFAQYMDLDEIMGMNEKEREEVKKLLDDKTIKKLKKLEEGGLL